METNKNPKEHNALRILHTSDLHLGLTIYQWERLPEQRDMLRQLCEIAEARDVDAVIISGDVFHTGSPSNAACRAFAEGITRLAKSNGGIPVFVTGGNHDSPSRLESNIPFARELGIHIVGGYHPDMNVTENMVLEIPGRGWIAAVPFINERMLPDGFYPQVLEEIAARNADSLPVVLMAHTSVEGCSFIGHSNSTEKTIGGIDSVNLSVFGDGYDYLALGHIHQPHDIPACNKRARYCGTPLAVSFDEAYEHSVSIVTLKGHGGDVEVETVCIEDPCPLITVPSAGDLPWESALHELESFPADRKAYLRVNIVDDGSLPYDASDQIAEKLEGKQCRFCTANFHRPDVDPGEGLKSISISEFRETPPIDIAEEYARSQGIEFDDDMRDIFNRIARELDI